CGYCGNKNSRTGTFSFLSQCEHCGAIPKTYRCQHCGRLIPLVGSAGPSDSPISDAEDSHCACQWVERIQPKRETLEEIRWRLQKELDEVDHAIALSKRLAAQADSLRAQQAADERLLPARQGHSNGRQENSVKRKQGSVRIDQVADAAIRAAKLEYK